MKWPRILVVFLCLAWIEAYLKDSFFYPYADVVLLLVLLVYWMEPQNPWLLTLCDFTLCAVPIGMGGGINSPLILLLAFPFAASPAPRTAYTFSSASAALLFTLSALADAHPLAWGKVALIVLFLFALAFFASESSRLEAAYQKRLNFLERTKKLLEGFHRITTPDDLRNLLNAILPELQKFFKSDWIAVAAINWEKDRLEPLACTSNPEDLERLRGQLAAGQWRNTFSGRAVLAQENLLARNPNEPAVQERELDAKSGIFIPLGEKEAVFAVLMTGNNRENAFSASDLETLALAACMMSPLIKNALLRVSEQTDKSRGREPVEVLQDLEVAKILQRKMLPPNLPELEGVEMAARLIPAKEVSGDFYDCFLLREKTLAINIGDVSGKSIPAALLVSMAKYIFRFPPSLYIRPSKLMELANKIVYMNGGGLFISDCFATLDLARNQFIYVNAGHPPLIHLRAKDGTIAFLPPTGSLLGISEESRYREEAVPLNPGDLLLFYSDGLTEVKLPGKKVLGEEGLAELFRKYRDLPPPALLDAFVAEILGMYEALDQKRDDISCIVMKIS